MTDLDALLSNQLQRFEVDLPADADLPLGSGMSCEFEAILLEPDLDAEGPTVTAYAEVAPGGAIGEARLVAREGYRSQEMDIADGSGLHRALRDWFDAMWWDWDEVPVETTGEALSLPVSDLRPGDHVWRFGLAVVDKEADGTNTAGERMLRVHFEGTDGTEVWPAGRVITVLRETDDHDGEFDG